MCVSVCVCKCVHVCVCVCVLVLCARVHVCDECVRMSVAAQMDIMSF